MTSRKRLLVIAVATLLAGLVAGVVSITTATASPPAGPSAPYVPGTDGHRPGHPTGIRPNQAGDPSGSHFGQYDPGAWGWTWAPGSIPFSYHGHSFPQGVVNADVATIDTKILDIIVPKMSESLCHAGDCWGYEVRLIAGSSSRSFHGYGLALDVNAETNGQTSQPMSKYTTTLPLNTGSLIRPYGAEWGGDWSADSPRDPMHIEIHLSPAGAKTVAAKIRSGVAPRGPAFARFGSTVTLTGQAAPNAGVTVWLLRRGTAKYVGHAVTATSTGAWTFRYRAADDYWYSSSTGGMTSPAGRTRIEPYLTGPATVRRGSTVTITGTGRPQTTLTVFMHRRYTTGYYANAKVTVTGSGTWQTRYAANDDYRYYVVDNITKRVSNYGLTQVR